MKEATFSTVKNLMLYFSVTSRLKCTKSEIILNEEMERNTAIIGQKTRNEDTEISCFLNTARYIVTFFKAKISIIKLIVMYESI